MKEFKGLLRSEIKKAERLANKATGTDNCRITGYSWKEEHPIDFAPECTFIEVRCEICHDYEERADVDIILNIPMFDRRMTKASIA
ncbi:MAG: hypothetical protein LUG62_01110 [Clostridiales bacterium]|nr:hypothetical protein [Clostridiales bacterium]